MNYQVAAYFPEWTGQRPYSARVIDQAGLAPKITVINYAFGMPGPSAGGQVVAQFRDAAAAYQRAYSAAESVDGSADQPGQPLRGHFNQLRQLKARHPHLKVVVSLGGWTDSTWFSDAARTPESRRAFVASCIDTYIHGHLPPADPGDGSGPAGGPGAAAGVFDGIDIDWEYPVGGGLDTMHTDPADAENFVLLLAEFRRQYAEIGRPDLLLTAALPGPAQAAQFNIDQGHAYLDWVALMTYDLRGDWHPVTGHHTNLYNSDLDPAPPAERLSADTTVKVYRDRFGVPAEKLLLGAAFYGKGWRGAGPRQNGLFQPGQPLGEYAGNYHYLIERMQRGFTRHWDESAQAPWLYHPGEQIFITYDDPQSLAAKAEYIKQNGLGGVMFWELTGDDEQSSLLNTLHDRLAG